MTLNDIKVLEETYSKDILLVLTLDLSSISTSNIKERASYIWETIDKPIIKVGKL